MDEKTITLEALRRAKLEKIIEKYGEDVLVDTTQTDQDEESAKQREKLEKKLRKVYAPDVEKVDVGGFLVSKELVRSDNNRTCPVCNTYSFSSKDDLYMNKFECCFDCYIQYVENREERWKTGWRPDHENFKNKTK